MRPDYGRIVWNTDRVNFADVDRSTVIMMSIPELHKRWCTKKKVMLHVQTEVQ